MIEPLTATQARMLEFLISTIEQTGCQPTMREIGLRFGITSPNGVRCHLQALIRKGWLIRTRKRWGLGIAGVTFRRVIDGNIHGSDSPLVSDQCQYADAKRADANPEEERRP
jgi:repressor LexA